MILEIAAGQAGTHGSTLADRTAAANWSANLRALSATQPGIVEPMQAPPEDVEWVLARDGYLTVRDAASWWSGCALPLRAAQYMMRTLNVAGPVACMLDPAHAAQVRVVLDLLKPAQAVVALVPNARAMRILLGCDDFSREIAAHRLWFAWGQAWEAELAGIFARAEGLPTPMQFVRPIYADNSFTDSLVGPAQRVFAQTNSTRAAELRAVRDAWRPTNAKNLCLIAPSHFRLWDDAGAALLDAMTQSGEPAHARLVRVDPDDPAAGSPLSLARIAGGCGVIVTANLGRADLPDVAHPDMPWVTWATTPRIPPAAGRGKRDGLLLADPMWKALALWAGWPAERVGVAAWPPATSDVTPPSPHPLLAMIVDLPPLEPPSELADFSSRGLLWDAVRAELSGDPFALTDIDVFLDQRMRRAGIELAGFDRKAFIERLVIPAYQEGLAGVLIRAGMPLRCYGAGWESRDALRSVAAGPIVTRRALQDACSAASAVVHCWPASDFQAIDAMGRPVLRPFAKKRESFLRDAHSALQGKLGVPSPTSTQISVNEVLRIAR